jgi:hypothetical protein
VSSDEEHNEGKLQHVVEYEVATDPGRGIDPVDIGREEVCNISNLEDEKSNPEPISRCSTRYERLEINIPVDGGNDNV